MNTNQIKIKIQQCLWPAAISSLVFWVILFVIVPMRHVRIWTGSLWTHFTPYHSFSIVAVGMLTITLFLMHYLYRKKDASVKNEENQSYPVGRPIAKFHIALTLFIFLAILNGMLKTPLGTIEHIHAVKLVNNELTIQWNPFITDKKYKQQNHVLAHIASWVSMKVFGVNKIAYRFPALIFTAAFLLAILILGTKFLKPFTLTLILINLSANEFFQLHAHSARGYISMMLFTLLMYLMLLELGSPQKINSKYSMVAFSFIIVGCIFSGLFGSLMIFLILFSLLLWLAIQKNRLSEQKMIRAKHYLRHFYFWIPIGVIVLLFNGIHLKNIGNFDGIQNVTPQAIANLTGLSRLWVAKSLVLLTAAVLFFSFNRIRHRGFSLPDIVFLVSLSTLILSYLTLNIEILYGRYLFTFLIPFLCFIAEGTSTILQPIARRSIKVFVIAIFGIAPLVLGSKSEVMGKDGGRYVQYDRFIQKVIQLTSPVSENCYYIRGRKQMVLWLADFYLHSTSTNNPDQCKNHYHIILTRQSPPPKDFAFEHDPKMVELFRHKSDNSPQDYLLLKQSKNIPAQISQNYPHFKNK